MKKNTGEPVCNTIDDCFRVAKYAGTGEYEEDILDCKYGDAEDITLSIAGIILCGRRIEQLFKENKFTDNPELNKEVIEKVQAFLNIAEGE